MTSKSFVLCFVGLFASIVFGNALLNLVTNPYEIFDHKLLGEGTYHNQRYEKINFLKANHHRFNAYLIGSSRIGLITPQEIQSYIPNTRFYNAWLSSGNPLDAQIFITWLLQNRYEVTHLIIQIGLDHAINIVDYRAIQDMQRLWHYDLTQSSPIDFYSPYLFGFPTRAVRQKLTYLLSAQESPQTEDIQSGTWRYITREKARKEDPESYIRNEPTFHRALPTQKDFMPAYQIEMLTQALQGIAQQCQTHRIQCVFLTPPLYYKDTLRYTPRLRDSIIKILAQSLPEGFWHFGYINSITTDEKNYYESTHQVPEIDTMMLDKIFNPSAKDIPNDFGILITQANLSQALHEIHTIEQGYRALAPLK